MSTCENVKLLCLEFMLESAAEQHGADSLSISLVSWSPCWNFLKTMITEDSILNCISTRVSGRLCLNHTFQKDSRGVLGTSFWFGPTLEIFSKTFNMAAQSWWKLTAKGAVLSPEKRNLHYCWRNLRLSVVSFEVFLVLYSKQSFYKCLINLLYPAGRYYRRK